MSKVRRYFYVGAPRSAMWHIMFGTAHSEGRTACGRTVRKGWEWMQTGNGLSHVCKRCAKAGL
jgi:hypothetical protein